MDECADAHADQYIGKYFSGSGKDLFPGIFDAVPDVQFFLGNVDGFAVADVFLHLVLQMHFFDERAAGYGNYQAKCHIDDRDLPAEDTHKQHQTAQVHHG